MQKDVDQWVSQYTPAYWQPHEILARLIEEVGELAREINHQYGPKKKKGTEHTKEIADEIGDIIFTIICLANREKIDLDSAWENVMAKCYNRDAERFTKK